jgi:uncharacterized protein with PQ loop repeat
MTAPHWVGIVGTTLIMLAFVPQIALLLRTRRAGALSVKSNALNATASGVLFGYALLRGDLIFLVVMGFQLAATIVIVVLNILYRGDAA